MFKLSIVTPEKTILEADCKSLIVPGSDGYLGVLTDHAPLITALKPGELKIVGEDSDAQLRFAITGGFFEVSNNHATVLADAIEEPANIDVARAENALSRARERLSGADAGVDAVRANQAVWRAKNRLEIARRK